MRAKVQQIVWHGKEPVYSLDFHPDGTLATGGGDKEIKVRTQTSVALPCMAYLSACMTSRVHAPNC